MLLPGAVEGMRAPALATVLMLIQALDTVPPDLRLVVASSMDVYRAYTSLWAGHTTDAVPLTEDAALRTEPPPDQHGPAPTGWDIDMSAYDKLDVERAYLHRDATVCRLPFVYGEHDYNHREEFVLRRIRAGRPQMPIGPAGFLGSRGYAPELARGLRLALEAQEAGTVTGEVFNLCETRCAPMALRVRQIIDAAGGDLDLVQVPSSALPPDLALTGDMSQHLLADPAKARHLLGWAHQPPPPLIEHSVTWHLAHPPDPSGDFSADDRALATAR